jgi:hypothetical protein
MPNHSLNDSHMPSQAIYLDSNDATLSISDAEKIFYLNSPIIADAGIRILIGLTNLTIPNSIFNFTTNNNTITFTQSSSTQAVSVSVGNYSASTLVTVLNTAITAAGLNITVSFDEENALFTFTGSSAFTIDSATMSRQLGLNNQLPTASGTTYTATQVCDFAGATNLYIRIRNVSMNNLDSRGKTSNIIASIVNNVNYGDYIFYTPPEVLYFMINEQQLSHIDIEITDQEGNIINLNGATFNLTLSVHFVVQRETNTPTNRVLGEIQRQEIEAESQAQSKQEDKPTQEGK